MSKAIKKEHSVWTILYGLDVLLWCYLVIVLRQNVIPSSILCGILVLGIWVIKRKRTDKLYRLKKGLRKITVSDIAEMDGITFEQYCILNFIKLGWEAKPTPTTGDYGADILLRKRRRTVAVQCKRYKGKVGVAAVQEAIGAKGFYKMQDAMVITNSTYTPNARTLAKANNVEIWDINDIIKNFNVKQ